MPLHSLGPAHKPTRARCSAPPGFVVLPRQRRAVAAAANLLIAELRAAAAAGGGGGGGDGASAEAIVPSPLIEQLRLELERRKSQVDGRYDIYIYTSIDRLDR